MNVIYKEQSEYLRKIFESETDFGLFSDIFLNTFESEIAKYYDKILAIILKDKNPILKQIFEKYFQENYQLSIEGQTLDIINHIFLKNRYHH